MTLRQLGRYQVQSFDEANSTAEGLRTMAEAQQLDFIMYGTISQKSGDGITCRLSVFDRAKGKTAVSRTNKAAGVLDIFDVADDLVVSVLESMTGAHIGFGSVAIKNTGETGHHAILVDGYLVGQDLENIDRVLTGRHKITVVQKRMLGDREIASSTINVGDSVTSNFTFSIPYLMDDEKAKIEGLRSAVHQEWNDRLKKDDVEGKIKDLESLLTDVSYSPKLSEYKDEATQFAGEWILQKARFDMEDSAWEPKIDALSAGYDVYTKAKTYPNSEKIQQTFEGEALLMETLFELAGGKALSDGDIAKGLGSFENALMVSTRYLDGARMTDNAFAVTVLQGIQADAGGAQLSPKLMTVFGTMMAAGRRFYKLKDQVESGTNSVLVASDLAIMVSVDGGEYGEAPLALKPSLGPRDLSVQPKVAGKPIALASAPGQKLLYASDGYAPYGEFDDGKNRGELPAGSLPRATISINGSLDQWKDIPATLIGASGKVGNTFIEKVYLAVDSDNFYMRFDIKDPTKSSLLHFHNFSTIYPKIRYRITLEHGDLGSNVVFAYDRGTGWQAWITENHNTGNVVIATTTTDFAMKGSTAVAAFPLKPLLDYIGPPMAGTFYKISAGISIKRNKSDPWINLDTIKPMAYTF